MKPAAFRSLVRRISAPEGARPARRPPAASQKSLPAGVPSCAGPHLFERGKCRHCGCRSPFARAARGQGQACRRLDPLERDEQKAIITLLVRAGCHYSAKDDTDIYVLGTKRPRHLAKEAHRTYQTPGIPDLFAFLPAAMFPIPDRPAPRCVWIEVKAVDGRPSEAQERFERQCGYRKLAHVMGTADAVLAFLVHFGFLKG